MKKIQENHIDVAMGRELDDEGSIIMNQLDELEHYCQMLRQVITSSDMQAPGGPVKDYISNRLS